MKNLSVFNTYLFHGLRLGIASNESAVPAALHARLRQFASNGNKPCDLTFEFSFVPDKQRHLVEKPTGRSRNIQRSPTTELSYFEDHDQIYLNYNDRMRVICNPSQGSVQLSILGAETGNLWTMCHPMFTIPFVELLKRRRVYSLHAAGLCINGRGLVFPGDSGSGKTTLTLALLRAGFGFLGDDMVLLAPTQNDLRMLAFPDEIDVTDETAGLFPELQAFLDQPKTPGWHKRQVWAEKVYNVDFVEESRPAVLIFPRIAHTDKSILKPMNRTEALMELIPNVLLTEAHSSQAHLDVLAQLVRETDCYRLETGRDFDRLPTLIRDLVA